MGTLRPLQESLYRIQESRSLWLANNIDCRSHEGSSEASQPPRPTVVRAFLRRLSQALLLGENDDIVILVNNGDYT